MHFRCLEFPTFRAPEVEEFRMNLYEAKTPLLGKAWQRRGGRAITKYPRSFERRGRGNCEKIGIKRYSPPCITALLCPTSFAGHGGIEDNWRESRSPLLVPERVP